MGKGTPVSISFSDVVFPALKDKMPSTDREGESHDAVTTWLPRSFVLVFFSLGSGLNFSSKSLTTWLLVGDWNDGGTTKLSVSLFIPADVSTFLRISKLMSEPISPLTVRFSA